MRTILAYASGDLSLKSVSAWARALGIGRASSVALFRRLAKSGPWLECLLRRALEREAPPVPVPRGLRARLVDATVLCGPRALGTEWRVHALYDPEEGRLASLEVTDERGGEGLWRFASVGRGDLLVADACYGTARSFRWAVSRGAHALLRVTPSNLRVVDPSGARFDLASWAKEAKETPEGVWMALPGTKEEKETPVRLIRFLSPKGTVVLLMTSLREEEASDEALVSLYRLRWQVELLFKRWKSLADLGEVPRAHHGPTARPWILARLLLAALAQEALGPTSRGRERKNARSGEASSARSGRCGPRCSPAASPAS